MLFDDIIYDNLDIFGYNHLFNLVSVDSEQTGGTFNTFRQTIDGAGAPSEIPNDFDDLYLPFNKTHIDKILNQCLPISKIDSCSDVDSCAAPLPQAVSDVSCEEGTCYPVTTRPVTTQSNINTRAYLVAGIIAKIAYDKSIVPMYNITLSH